MSRVFNVKKWIICFFLAALWQQVLAQSSSVPLDVYEYWGRTSSNRSGISLNEYGYKKTVEVGKDPTYHTSKNRNYKSLIYIGKLSSFIKEVPAYTYLKIRYDALMSGSKNAGGGSATIAFWIAEGDNQSYFAWDSYVARTRTDDHNKTITTQANNGGSPWFFDNRNNATPMALSKDVSLCSDVAYGSSQSNAIWTANNIHVTYTIVEGKNDIYYEPNGGEGAELKDTKDYSGSITLKGADAFVRTDYYLDSWNTKADGSGTKYATGSTYSEHSGMKLYAQWKPYMRPKNISFTEDKWNQRIKIAWQIEGNDVQHERDGKLFVFRKAQNETAFTKLAELEKTATTYTDNNLEVGVNYTYSITFVPTSFGAITQPVNSGITATKTTALDKSFAFTNIQKNNLKEGAGGILLSWTPEKPGANVTVEKYLPSSKSWTELYSGNATSFTDKDVETFGEYKYRLKTTYWDNVFYSEDINITYMVMSEVTQVKASQGYYNNMVKINWSAEQYGTSSTRYVLSRKLMTDPKATYTDIYEVVGLASNYYFEDVSAQPGQYYYYKVTAFAQNTNTGKWAEGNSIEADGFNTSRGILSGRVTFGTGTAVEGVSVRLTKNVDSDDSKSQFYALQSTDAKGLFTWNIDENTIKEKFQKQPFAVQMWISPDQDENMDTYQVVSMGESTGIVLGKTANGKLSVKAKLGGSVSDTGIEIPCDSYSNVTMTYDGASTATVYVVDGIDSDGKVAVKSKAFSCDGISLKEGDAMMVGTDGNTGYFKGSMDDIRVWSKALTESDVLKNYNRILAGTEESLLCYWPLDEGASNIPFVYDYSRTNGIANGHHAVLSETALATTEIPTNDQLSLYGLTDAQGNYIIRGVPFSGDGSSYLVAPVLGTHEFNPAYVTRYVSNNSLTHNAVDFTDISSFKVRGLVTYENTTIPVEEAMLYVDGSLAVKDGEPVKTNENGEFAIDVPIGSHYVAVKKDGHTFADNGRFPADPNDVGTRYSFTKEMTGLTFYDNTTVTVAGRVVGGDIEKDKVLGFQQSKANIGQAQVTLDFVGSERYYINAVKKVDGLTTSYEQSTEQRNFSAPSEKIKSTAMVEGKKNAIVIMTDPKTGEFAALLPPLKYKASSITIPSQPELDFTSNLPSLDASKPNQLYKDSLLNEEYDKYEYFEYAIAAKVGYKSASVMDVTENQDGSYGMESVEVQDVNGKSESVKLYTVDEKGQVNYTFGNPVYQQFCKYGYKLYAYEPYVNKDDADNPVWDRVPLKNAEVTIQNQFAMDAYVKSDGTFVSIEDNVFNLDAEGKATYQFKVGMPNIQEPYTRGISISYNNAGTMLQWSHNNDFRAIVLGMLPSGNNFVTKGPDEVSMILRDPPGTNSSTTYSVGTTKTSTKTVTVRAGEDFGLNTTTVFGAKLATWEGVGAGTITEASSSWTLDVGLSENYSYEGNNTFTTTTTCNQEISTSDGPDFVGAVGDVFIGSSSNITLGTSRDVVIAKNEQSGDYELSVKTNMVASQEYTTAFNYTANYIENVLIPNLQDARNNLITPVADVKSVTATGDKPIYVSQISPDDERFGLPNNDEVWGDKAMEWNDAAATQLKRTGRWDGPSYSILFPAGYNETHADEVQWYNSSIKKWEQQLYNNEKAKVTAMENRSKYFDKNYSFDAGSSVTVTKEKVTVDESERSDGFDINLTCGQTTEATINKCGVTFAISEQVTSGGTKTFGNSEENATAFSYTLSEDGDDDYLTVDVYDAPDQFGPIFSTRGGATCAPFEDEVVTKYYKPGTVLQVRTLQIEKPELEILDQAITGVPSGKEANLRVVLRNNSETGEDCYYGLWVDPESNPDGAQVFLDGVNITPGVKLLIPAGKAMQKTLTVSQSNKDVLSYKDISLRLYSTSQPDDTGVFPGIYSSKKFSVYFQPSCSDIKLEASAAVVNADSESPLMLSMSGYDYNQESFKRIRLQYKGINDANFVTVQEFAKEDDPILKTDKTLKPFAALTGSNKLSFPVDLRDAAYTDQTYVFRAMTVGLRGSEEVTTLSDEVNVVRDMNRPQLISNPTPSNGILGAADDITVTFNEDIRSNLLTKLGNFSITGVMNEAKVNHDVALSLTNGGVAKTEATINLADKSFAADVWLKYSADGTILQHGTKDNSFAIGTDNGKLVISVGQQKVISDVTLPKDKWVFLAFSYDNSGSRPVVSASYALDADIVTLISQKEVVRYEGNGPIALGGNGMTAQVQELSLWNEARSISDALTDRSRTKNPYTNGLIGYWQFNEGHGVMATDRSRSRHITLPAVNAWYLNSGTNYAVTLDGQTALKAATGVSTLSDESYMLELWFRAEEAKGKSTIMNIPGKMDVSLGESGNVEVTVGETTTNAYANVNLKDGQWHHMALNVLRSSGSNATLYIDGKARRSFSATSMPQLVDGVVILGAAHTGEGYSQYLKGNVDEFRVWKGRFASDFMVSNMFSRLDTKTDGLAAYYPLESTSLDGFGQVTTSGNAMDMSGHGLALQALKEGMEIAPTVDVTETLSLSTARERENVQFDFVASERQITIHIQEEPYKIENCNLYLTVKNVKDINGNTAQPISWTIYALQNNLKWNETDVALETRMGEEKSFSAEISNSGATDESWALTEMPSWLVVNAESGQLGPQKTKQLTFSVADGTPIGIYDATVYLTGNQGLNAPLNISLRVKGEAPDWNPVPDQNAMIIVGQLNMNGSVSSDSEDMVAAFRGTVCVGMAHPVYNARYDAYLLTMTVYGDADGESLTYKAYDASTGVVYPFVTSSKPEAYTFVASKWVGTFADVTVFKPEDKVEQDLSLDRKGWKWFSLYLNTNEDNRLSSVFSHSVGKVSAVKDSQKAANYDKSYNAWFGALEKLQLGKMYKLKADAEFDEVVAGTQVSPDAVDISLDANGWSWIGYPLQVATPVAEALADADPQDGDVIMGQSSFAMYDNGGWSGSLAALTPGDGYKYYSNSNSAKTFHYPRTTAYNAHAAQNVQVQDMLQLTYPDNMAMVAQVVKNGSVLSDKVSVETYANGELCGLSSRNEEEGAHFITIGGNSAEAKMTFVIRTTAGDYVLRNGECYAPDRIVGSKAAPYALELSQATAVENIHVGDDVAKVDYYDINGHHYSGDFVPSGVYVKRVTYVDGLVLTFKGVKVK